MSRGNGLYNRNQGKCSRPLGNRQRIAYREQFTPSTVSTRAQQADDARYQQAADWFKRKRPEAEEPAAVKKIGSLKR
jgi:hypothetical protein